MNSASPHLSKHLQARHKQKGATFVIVMAVVLAVGLVTALALNTSRLEVRMAAAALEQIQRNLTAEAGALQAIARLSAEGSDALGEISDLAFQFAGYDVTVTGEDEWRKLDVNAAPEIVLTNAFVSYGLPLKEAQALTDRIADWRDEDRLVRINGAEEAEYARAEITPGPANRQYLTVGELGRVLDFPAALLACADRLFTVHTRARFAYGGAQPTEPYQPYGEPAQAAPNDASEPVSPAFQRARQFYVITATAVSADGRRQSTVRRTVLVRQTPDGARPATIHSASGQEASACELAPA